MAARLQLALAGRWLGARNDRQATKGWNPLSGAADDDLLDDLPLLRSRSRDLQRRSPLALGAINTDVTSIVGTGLALRARPDVGVLHISPDQAEAWRATTEREFRSWAENAVACDQAATLNFYSQQALALRSSRESGDVFATLPMIERPSSAYALKINLIEADRVCNKDNATDREDLVSGVERDANGAPRAYHIARQHPGALRNRLPREWDIVPAFGERTGRRNVIHLHRKLRPGQTRGIPHLAPVIELLKQISDYSAAELSAAVVSAMFTVFIETESGQGLDLSESGGPATGSERSGDDVKLGAGAIIDLAKGEKASFANPNRPNSAADVFLQAMMRQLGVALELPYEVLVKHFTASYSAARAALLEAWRYFRAARAWLAEMFCQPIYEAWLEEAVLRGRIDAPGFLDDPALRAAWAGAEWIGDGPGQIDPLKEVEAAQKRIDASLSNHTIETMELRGMDWQEVNAQLGRELAQRKALETFPAKPAQADVPAPQDNTSTDQGTS